MMTQVHATTVHAKWEQRGDPPPYCEHLSQVASLVVLSKDPLADITNTRTVTRVMIRVRLLLADSVRNRW